MSDLIDLKDDGEARFLIRDQDTILTIENLIEKGAKDNLEIKCLKCNSVRTAYKKEMITSETTGFLWWDHWVECLDCRAMLTLPEPKDEEQYEA